MELLSFADQLIEDAASLGALPPLAHEQVGGLYPRLTIDAPRSIISTTYATETFRTSAASSGVNSRSPSFIGSDLMTNHILARRRYAVEMIAGSPTRSPTRA